MLPFTCGKSKWTPSTNPRIIIEVIFYAPAVWPLEIAQRYSTPRLRIIPSTKGSPHLEISPIYLNYLLNIIFIRVASIFPRIFTNKFKIFTQPLRRIPPHALNI